MEIAAVLQGYLRVPGDVLEQAGDTQAARTCAAGLRNEQFFTRINFSRMQRERHLNFENAISSSTLFCALEKLEFTLNVILVLLGG